MIIPFFTMVVPVVNVLMDALTVVGDVVFLMTFMSVLCLAILLCTFGTQQALQRWQCTVEVSIQAMMHVTGVLCCVFTIIATLHFLLSVFAQTHSPIVNATAS